MSDIEDENMRQVGSDDPTDPYREDDQAGPPEQTNSPAQEDDQNEDDDEPPRRSRYEDDDEDEEEEEEEEDDDVGAERGKKKAKVCSFYHVTCVCSYKCSRAASADIDVLLLVDL
jgi:transcription elongation factor SPT5